MQPSTLANHLYVEDRSIARPPMRWRTSPMSRAVQRARSGLWFRTAAIFLVSLSAGLLGLNAVLLLNASANEPADAAFGRTEAVSATALPAPTAPMQGVVANAAGVGRVIIAEPLPVATLTTDAYTVVGNGVQASSYRIAAGTTAAGSTSRAASDGPLSPLSAPVPVNASPAMAPMPADEATRNADEAMRVIAASTPSVDRARAHDPALVGDADAAPAGSATAEPGVWYGDAGMQ
ncbi:MAG: hypothetical protein ACTHOH_10895 [Lysobacteraceae bacterium]